MGRGDGVPDRGIGREDNGEATGIPHGIEDGCEGGEGKFGSLARRKHIGKPAFPLVQVADGDKDRHAHGRTPAAASVSAASSALRWSLVIIVSQT